MFAISGEKGCAIDEVCKSIVRKKIDRENYSLVTETDLYDMLSMYDSFLQCAELFKHPYKASISTKNKTTPMQDKIKELISKMELPTRSKVEVDEYTRFLINFVRRNTMEVQDLRDKHMEMIDKEGLHALNPGLFPCGYEPSFSDITFHLELVLDDLTNWRRDHIRDQLMSATLPLFLVCDKSLAIANEVFEIIEVAELRRIALGSRFINRNHLLWAFYECGFGLPPKIRDNLDLPIAEEDHPPYVIYLASKELATSSTTSGFEVEHTGEKKKKLLLEHFVFSILYAKNIIDDKKQVKEMEEHFKTFVEVVALDGINRPNSGSVSWLEAYRSASDNEDQT
ncbi:uncharacterized protein LOC141658555 [Silene latifolia]|uniref:uncharacterized protein LOC141658555 n=1 Tax=Silene latifolia TaxID=37657 RepID=UPI003D76C450